MKRYKLTDNDGPCDLLVKGECSILKRGMVDDKKCCTFACRFYKPRGMGDWVRKDSKDEILMYEPREAIPTFRDYGEEQ